MSASIHPPAAEDSVSGRGRPNIVMVVLDDVGFSDLGCYGSSIATPMIDSIANEGLRYNNFHVTPMCSPSRACLLTGRNHHSVGMGMLANIPSDAPGYTARIPDTAGMLPTYLRQAGYATFAVGKWHLAPGYECGPAGPFDRWPLAKGFDRYYGFLHHSTDQWFPQLVRDCSVVEQPFEPEHGYHLTEDLVSESIDMIGNSKARDSDRPFFLYLATGAMHFPHQAPAEFIESHRGAFDHGWDVERAERHRRQIELGVIPPDTVNTERPPTVPAWEDRSEQDRGVFARQMEVFAGFLTHTDTQLGRIVNYLKAIDEWDNTIFVLTSDNGATAEKGDGTWSLSASNDMATMAAHVDEFGGVGSYNGYAAGWAWAGNTPFKYWKYYTWLGGVRTALVARWSGRMVGEGSLRSQFTHAVDVLPTLMEAAGIDLPRDVAGIAQSEVEGRSFYSSFTDRDAPNPRDTQYFEMWGSRSIYADGLKATTNHIALHDTFTDGSKDFSADVWSLSDLRSDFSEARDLAADEPARLSALVEAWELEAERFRVLPLNDDPKRHAAGRPDLRFSTFPQNRYVAVPSIHPVEMSQAILAKGGEILITLEKGRATEGTIFSLYQFGTHRIPVPVWELRIEGGFLEFEGAHQHALLRSQDPLPPEATEIRLCYQPIDDDLSTLDGWIDDDHVLTGRLTRSAIETAGQPLPLSLYVGRTVTAEREGLRGRHRIDCPVRQVVVEISDPL